MSNYKYPALSKAISDIANVWRGKGLFVQEQQTTLSVKVAHERIIKWDEKMEVQE